MREAERLREALKCTRRNLNYESSGTFSPLESISAATTIIDEALSAESDACIYTYDSSLGMYRTSCGRLMDPDDFEGLEMHYCPAEGCGAPIKVVNQNEPK